MILNCVDSICIKLLDVLNQYLTSIFPHQSFFILLFHSLFNVLNIFSILIQFMKSIRLNHSPNAIRFVGWSKLGEFKTAIDALHFHNLYAAFLWNSSRFFSLHFSKLNWSVFEEQQLIGGNIWYIRLKWEFCITSCILFVRNCLTNQMHANDAPGIRCQSLESLFFYVEIRNQQKKPGHKQSGVR